MAENSHISWTTHTFNSHWGCTKVSGGCKHCYADALSHRYGHDVWGPTAGRKPMSEAYWGQLAKWERQAAATGIRPRVFCNSMSDLFEGPETCQDPDAYEVVVMARMRLLGQITACPHLDFLLLTKRPENMTQFAPPSWAQGWPPNAWAGTSVEDQAAAAERVPCLMSVPAVRFLSCEPLLGPVDLDLSYPCPTCGGKGGGRNFGSASLDDGAWDCGRCDGTGGIPFQNIPDWVIAGGESGPNARPMHPDWARSLRDQCIVAGVPFHFKQWGEWAVGDASDDFLPDLGEREDADPRHFRVINAIGEDCTGVMSTSHPLPYVKMRRVGKKTAGRLLDGRTWDEFPAAKEGVIHA